MISPIACTKEERISLESDKSVYQDDMSYWYAITVCGCGSVNATVETFTVQTLMIVTVSADAQCRLFPGGVGTILRSHCIIVSQIVAQEAGTLYYCYA